MSAVVAVILWQRLDLPGHDLCRLLRMDDGWRLSGHVVFDEGGFCSLGYEVDCDEDWVTRSASVSGSIDLKNINLHLESKDGAWALNGEEQPALSGLIDVDLGFTPATNLVAIRRLTPGVQPVTALAAYLPFPDLIMKRLEQSYRQLDDGRYVYESPAHAFSATLTVSAEGFVTDYPRLWTGRIVKP